MGSRMAAGAPQRAPLAAVAVALALAGGACAAPFRCPAAGGPPWRELASEHFTLSTDMSRDDAHEAVQDLEDFRASLIATAWPRQREPRGRVRVVIVEREPDWRSFEGSRDGFYTEALFQPFIALRAGGSDHTRMRIRHELTHHLSRFYVRTQPEWLAEGLATFFETMIHDRATGEVLVGVPQTAHLQALAQPGTLHVPETLTGALKAVDTPAFYATSWLLVHYFISRKREDFAAYMRALDGGVAPEAAWRQSFGDLSPQVLAAELRGYNSFGRSLVRSNRYQAPATTIDERPLPDAEVHALRGLLFMRALSTEANPTARAQARQEIAESLRQDPHNVLALAVRAFVLEEPVDRQTARVLTERAPDSWLAWLLLFRAGGGTLDKMEGRRAAMTAVRLTAGDPSIKLPFGPQQPLFETAAPPPVLRACPAAPPPRPAPAARLRPPRGLDACPSGRALSAEDALAELRAIVTSDVSWCFFDLASWQPVTVAIEVDERGQAASICLDTPPPDPRLTACVTRALAAVSFPALPGCPRLRLFQLAQASDGHVQVFGSAR
jgi:hypothetical protein